LKVLFQNAHLYDPSCQLDGMGEVLVEDHHIREIGLDRLDVNAHHIVDLEGKYLLPGFIDIHVHFREPGEEHKETIESGSRAAAMGGFTTVCCMPNTRPANDSVLVTKYILDKAKLHSRIRIHPISAASKGLEGKEMVEYGAMIDAGCIAVSDDGRCVMDPYFARKVLEYLSDFKVPFIEHCEDCRLSQEGAMNEGRYSSEFGLRGVPHAAEDIIVARDISLARTTKGILHLAHLSSRHSVAALRLAKSEGLKVSGEVTPHHLLLTEESLKNLDSNFKMAPPLRTEEDRQALVKALEEGIIEAIATDHAPHNLEEKSLEFHRAPNGVIGLETAFAACMKLVDQGELSFSRLVEALTSGPARVMGFKDRGQLKVGKFADFTVVDLKAPWSVEKNSFLSKSRNSPFMSWKMNSQVLATYVGGECVYRVGGS